MTIIDETILELLFRGAKDGNDDSLGMNPIATWILTAFPIQAPQTDSFTTNKCSIVTCTAQAVA